ncbi:MAG: chromosomal replication initiator protein DnaA [Clostridia bacterium]|nr:chromosomal replication initiator protein DnaA [Clostridia bacterium]
MDIELIWDNSMNSLKKSVSSQVGYNLYLKDAVPVSFDGKTFTVAVSMIINKNMIESRYKPQIEQILTNLLGSDTSLNILVSQNPAELKKEIPSVREPEHTSVHNSYDINPKYTFENFIIGASNEYATAAAIRAAEKPGNIYNPLFLYGDSGLGKTHLMHAIGNRIKKYFPDKKIVYVTSEKFMNDFIENVLKKTPKNFREIYRSADVLLIDDIQFLEKKESTQEELFHTFNELYYMNKQMVITSDRKPKDLITLEERLKNRFEWGLTIDITVPSFETRVAILKNKAELRGVKIDKEVFEYIADCFQSNVRELEGALLKVISYSQIKDKEINLPFAEECLKSFMYSGKVNVEKIIEKVCSYYEITKEDIIGKNKTKNFTLPRQVAMYLCNMMTELNYGAIAKSFGNRDRTTILHNVEKIKAIIKTDTVLNADIECIIKDIKNS